jgi:hypothetical protein
VSKSTVSRDCEAIKDNFDAFKLVTCPASSTCSSTASKPLPAHAWNSRFNPSSGTIGTGLSGTIGGRMRTVGSAGTSPSSTSQAYRILRTLW